MGQKDIEFEGIEDEDDQPTFGYVADFIKADGKIITMVKGDKKLRGKVDGFQYDKDAQKVYVELEIEGTYERND